MIPIPTGVRIWIATGHTDMRKGMQGLALLVQEGLGRNPFAGQLHRIREGRVRQFAADIPVIDQAMKRRRIFRPERAQQ